MGLAQQGWRTAVSITALGGLSYQGVWNATTNDPTITSGVGNTGEYYVVDVAGTTNIDGITDWEVGDWVIFNGTAWQKIDNTDQVSSVNGLQGAVSIGLDSVLGQNNSTGANDISVSTGQSIIYNNGGFTASINEPILAGNINLTLPSSSGTIALTSDIVTETLAQTLSAGNSTGTNDIIVSTDGNTKRSITTDNSTVADRMALNFYDGVGFGDYFTVQNPNGLGANIGVLGTLSASLGYQVSPTLAIGIGVNANGVTISTGGGYTGDFLINKEVAFKLQSTSNAFTSNILPSAFTANRTATLQDASGTIAYLSDIVVETLAQTLTAGNTTGANNISISSGQYIEWNFGTLGSRLDSLGTTGVRNWSLPNASGTIALTSDIPTSVLTITGTADRISITGTATNPIIDIASTYVGQTSITTLGTIATGTWNGTGISEVYGGTGQTSYTQGDILYASANNVLSKLAIGSAGTFLRSNNSTVEWSGVSFANSAVTGDIIYASGTNNYDNLSVGNNGQVLTLAGGVPSWATPTNGTVTGTGTTNFLSKWTSATAQGDSLIQDNGTLLGIGATPIVNIGLYFPTTQNQGILVNNTSTTATAHVAITGNTFGVGSTQENIGVKGIATNHTQMNVGVSGEASNPSARNIGGRFSATGGTLNNSLLLVDGTEGAGKVLTSDVNGYASWQVAGGGGSQTLAQTLVLGNTTGANNISITSGQNITYNEGLGGTLVSASTTVGAKVWTLPNNTGTIALTSDIPASIVTGTGTANYISKWSATGVQADSSMQDDGTSTSIGGSLIGVIKFRVISSASQNFTISALNSSTGGATATAITGEASGISAGGVNKGGNFTAQNNASQNIGLSASAFGATGVTNIGGTFNATGGTNNYALQLTDGTQGAGKVLTSDASGRSSWQTPSTGITGTGTTDYLARWTSSSAIGIGVTRDNGTTVGIGIAPNSGRKVSVAGFTGTNGTGVQSDIRGATSQQIGFNAIAGGATGQNIGIRSELLASGAGGTLIGGWFYTLGTCAIPTNPIGGAQFTSIGTVSNLLVNTGNASHNLGHYVCNTASHANDNVGMYVNVRNAGAGNAYSMLLDDGTQGVGKVLTSDANGYASWQVAGGGVSPVAETYTLANVVADRTFDPTSTTNNEIAQVLGTLITDLKTSGIIL